MVSSLLRSISSSADFSRLKNRRALPGEQYEPTDVEHLANVISHGVWILPSVLALLLMTYAAVSGLQMTTALVYGSALVLLFTTSTVFHILSYVGQPRELRHLLHICDRAVIYIFIAASYTPWLLLKEFHSWSEEVLCIVWIMALLGVTYVYLYHEKYKALEIFFYIVIGVCPAVCIMDMKDHAGLMELSLGGVMYISGVFFFKSDGIIPFAHAIWHCFVFVGSFCHFVAICTHLFGLSFPGL